ncbi:hypothetical protein FK268_04835 [Tsukamurella sputi]|uniref:Uncharacterized protein n=1 Tax=Tsukamurella sputi TaxID=2591848 RepID=A0A5C5RVL4_9ACTN|nr:hypothetical protein [Tsukamurella sputi]TWS26553.1 hypothetical protein FK268_04835 [Tsukamurella sputi]
MGMLGRRTQSKTLSTRIDFSEDTPPGKDSDVFSPTLRQYHRALWSRELPGGGNFNLIAKGYRPYLSHRSPLGDFDLSSDICVPGFVGRRRMESIIKETPYRAIDKFEAVRGTIGGRMIWPSRTINGTGTINGMRGFHPRISDRWDLTVECVRRHYAAQASPLSTVLEANRGFFDLFNDFRGFVDFFLLQDIVSPDYTSVRFLMPFDDFTTPALPADSASYTQYLAKATGYIRARNTRIASLKIRAPQ